MNHRRNAKLRNLDRVALVCVLGLAACAGDASLADVDDGHREGDDVAARSEALQLRWRRARSSWRNSTTAAGSTTAGAGMAGTGTAGSGAAGTGAAPTPSISGSSATTQFNGARCPNNAAITGACGHYGDQCTYDTSSGTHYCTCLAFAAENNGAQGWSCR